MASLPPFARPLAGGQHGFSLVELLLVLGVLSVLLVAAFVVYPQVRDRQLAQSESKSIFNSIAVLDTLAGPKGNYYGMGNLVANRAGAVPSAWNGGNRNTATITNRFGGAVQFIATAGGAGGCSGTSCHGIRMDFYGVPTRACQSMFPLFMARFRWVAIRADTPSSSWVTVKRPDTTFADPVGMAAAACASGDTLVFLLAT